MKSKAHIELVIGNSKHGVGRAISVIKELKGKETPIRPVRQGTYRIPLPADSINIADHLPEQKPTHWEKLKVTNHGQVMAIEGVDLHKGVQHDFNRIASRRIQLTLAG